MTRKHTRRTVRPLHNPLIVARNQAACLTAGELAEVLDPLRAAAARLRQGIASEDDHAMLTGSIMMAQSIEQQGVVRGLAGHLADIARALATVGARASEGGRAWLSPTLYFHEIEAVQLFIELHEFQLRQLSFREFRSALNLTTAHVRSARIPLVQLGAGAPG